MGVSRHWQVFYSLVPWWLPDTDLVEADNGELAYTRDLRTITGRAERHLAMPVVGQYDRGCFLGLIAIRCERRGSSLVPMACAIPETPIVEVRAPRNPYRFHGYGYAEDDGA